MFVLERTIKVCEYLDMSTENLLSVMRVLSEPTRLRLYFLLQEEEMTVAELQEILGMGQSRISTHLAQLKALGLARDRRVGKNIFYGAGDEVPESLGAFLEDAREALPEAARDLVGLRLALQKRKDLATEYFNRLAGKFGRTYIPGRSWQALGYALLELLPPMEIADLGAGEGMLSQLLARRAKRVVAVDNSPRMVEFGARLAKENNVQNLEFRLGDIEKPPLADGEFDLALFSQALHHTASPAKAIREAFRILKPGGKVAVLDLAAHSFEQAKELYAHVWLGFSEVELHELLRRAGFRDVQVRVIATEKNAPHFRTILATGIRAK